MSASSDTPKFDPVAAIESAESVPQLLTALRAASPDAEALVLAHLDWLRALAKVGGPLFMASVMLAAREFVESSR